MGAGKAIGKEGFCPAVGGGLNSQEKNSREIRLEQFLSLRSEMEKGAQGKSRSRDRGKEGLSEPAQ